jgi:hypothetical protein
MLVHHYWMWSDGSRSLDRTISESSYVLPERVPGIVVRTIPARQGEEIRLEFRTPEGWEVESTTVTDARGVGRLRPYPLCEADRWCTGPMDYRIVAGPETTTLTIVYTARR